ncbi:hypothetical protein Pla110_05390 [Polystyrenella longa]|uniref:Uncharacterized protein n=1 Tax=Polystyrenella longa TaxID=2528007 RepID=A0A518CHY0_9PLAN|nr:hypothetical protein [Polystyrenella longa]QDU78835.1 hypothetical protein Pla110_05390 [Polystyrenella longa]
MPLFSTEHIRGQGWQINNGPYDVGNFKRAPLLEHNVNETVYRRIFIEHIGNWFLIRRKLIRSRWPLSEARSYFCSH